MEARNVKVGDLIGVVGKEVNPNPRKREVTKTHRSSEFVWFDYDDSTTSLIVRADDAVIDGVVQRTV